MGRLAYGSHTVGPQLVRASAGGVHGAQALGWGRPRTSPLEAAQLHMETPAGCGARGVVCARVP